MANARAELVAQINKLQAKLNKLDSFPEDTFSFGTIILFSPQTGKKWYYLKTGEEAWIRLQNGRDTSEKTLAEWLVGALDANIGYFEVYVMNVSNNPIYTSE